MKIKWLGHASFLITSQGGVKIITDPYEVGGGIGYDSINESADIVVVSHDHADHNNVAAVGGKPEIVKGAGLKEIKEIRFKGIPSYHDESGGKQRGSNTIFCFTVDQVKLCHLGDLGHSLGQEQINEIGEVDILLVPVGGFFTIDASVATGVSDRLNPKVIIPMHFKTPKCDFPIASVDDFVRGKKSVRRLDTSELELRREELPRVTEIVVLRHAL